MASTLAVANADSTATDSEAYSDSSETGADDSAGDESTGDDADSAATDDAAEQFVASLQMQHGEIALPGKFAKITLPENFVYIDSKNAERLLTQGWGNPSGDGTIGMILPADVSPMSAEGWGIVLTYENDGYVSDEDAADIDYNDLLKDMQEATKDENDARKDAGFGDIDLVGWAVPPSYDGNQHKMVWAKELKFDGASENTLNYNIRVLGREGVLVLNAVASMGQLQTIRMETPALVSATEFLPGKRYEEFNEDTDKVAEYGLAALVAGGVAAKLGFFGKIGVFLLAFKKLIIAGVIGLGALISKLFGKKSG
ncbi:DUF2167 domain-containing protein [Permianibacter sp. IMCC34836]|nr:DUF2167 domain-containing protein [Permianibacter fluminis]